VPVTPLVAVVDDDESVCEAIKEFLVAFGLDAEAYSSAEEFLRGGSLEHTACLITDANMPGMSGFQLMEQLVTLRYRIPVIVVTGYANERSRAEAISAGAVCFLPKPVANKELLSCIQRALSLGHGEKSQRKLGPNDVDGV
jgi:FixJ family two-component response regulator